MSIWFRDDLTADFLNSYRAKNMVEHLDIRYVDVGDDYMVCDMPVDHRTQQPLGILHGGASCVLAETVASTAANCVINPETHYAVGLEINANHIASVREGRVVATTRPIHLGRTTQIWDIKLEDEKGRLTCTSRLTMMVIAKSK